jgi:membrane protease YdiL (CAAX protease family)
MSNLPEHDPLNPEAPCTPADSSPPPLPLAAFQDSFPAAEDAGARPEQPAAELPLFHSWSQPETFPPAHIPNLGHLFLLAVLTLFGLLGASLLTRLALHFHLFGISTAQQAISDIHYELGFQVANYLITFVACLLIFPLVWYTSFFAGLQWNGATALRLQRRLYGAASLCFVLALVNGILMPGPTDAPIDKIFRTPGAAWLLFGFGVTCAPLFEEIAFRGFLLPALCTAWDWAIERSTGKAALPLDRNGHPQWSFFAMAVASIAASLLFALMHGEQNGYALGPFLLLICVSLVLCWVRLSTRSLAASVLVHAFYNFLLFSLMLLGTGGFKHMDKM